MSLLKYGLEVIVAIASDSLFGLKMDDFSNSIKEMDISEMRLHLIYAKDLLTQLRGQLEEISYEMVEIEKHGVGHR